MTDLAIVRTVRALVAVGAALALTGTAIDFSAGHIAYWYTSYAALLTVYAVGLAVFVWLVVPRQPRNAAVWATATAALAGLSVFAFALAPHLADAAPGAVRYPYYVPAEHPALVARVYSVGQVAATVAVFVPLTFGLLLFPDGKLPTRRWRVGAWLAGAAVIAQCAAYIVALRPGATTVPEDDAAFSLAQVATLVAVVLGIVALFGRSRAASGIERQQHKWVMWGAAVGSAALIAAIALTNHDDSALPRALATGGFGVLVAAYAVALGRYRLYDVDVVISRTLVYGLLAGAITAAYVAGVVVSSQILGGSDRRGMVLAIAATAGVSVLFGPLRRRLQRLADQLLHGRQASPHEVLSEFNKRFATSDPELLGHAARLLVEGTAATGAEVWTRSGDRAVRAAAWPPTHIAAGEVTRISISHERLRLGELHLAVPAGRRLSDQDRRLGEHLASGVGLALRNQALTDSLQHRGGRAPPVAPPSRRGSGRDTAPIGTRLARWRSAAARRVASQARPRTFDRTEGGCGGNSRQPRSPRGRRRCGHRHRPHVCSRPPSAAPRSRGARSCDHSGGASNTRAGRSAGRGDRSPRRSDRGHGEPVRRGGACERRGPRPRGARLMVAAVSAGRRIS